MQWQIQPLTRLALAVGGALLVLGTDWPAALLVEGVSVGLLILTARLGRNWLRQLRLLLPMLTLLGLIGWWTLDPLTIGLALARLIILTSLFLVLFQTTAAEDLGEALTQVGLPRHWGFILGSAFHFVPVLACAQRFLSHDAPKTYCFRAFRRGICCRCRACGATGHPRVQSPTPARF